MYDARTGTGRSNGATMRFEPEAGDPANVGLSLARDMLLPVKDAHPNISIADLWAYAGALSVSFAGGPKVHCKFGRIDAAGGFACPARGLLLDAAQGADHIRKIFYRMGFNDQEIVALMGAHTLGRMDPRSGYDGPWTWQPLKFDNAYYRNLLWLEWRPKRWDGPLQYEDVQTSELMMLPTDIALKTDPEFSKFCDMYARDESRFFEDFAAAYSKLLNL